MVPIASYNGMLSHQKLELFERIWRCGLDKGSVSLEVGFEPGFIFLLLLLPANQDVTLNYFSSTMPATAAMHATMLPATENNGPSETLRKPLIKCLSCLTKVAMVIVSPHSNKQ